MLDTRGRKYFDKIFDKSGGMLIDKGLSPTNVTIIAATIGIVGAISFSFGSVILPIILLWLSGFLDAVDGSMARQSRRVSPVGTLLDIWLDRLVEISYIISFAIVCSEATFSLMILACTIILSMTIFLTSGMLIENTGIKSFHYQAGLMERTEGFIMFTIMIIFYQCINILAFIYAILILYTAMQRLCMAIKVLGGNNEK